MNEFLTILQQKTQHLGEFDILYLVILIAIFTFLLVVNYYLSKSKYRYKKILMLICCVFIARFILFYNPAAWFIYYKTLGWEDIGFRQVTVVTHELRHYFKPSENIKYMAIGSSQIGAIFSEYSKKNDDFYKLEFAGMGPIDYVLYRNYVKLVRPKQVILQLSEFDLAREPSYSTLKYAPSQGRSIVDYSNSLYALGDPKKSKLAIREMLISMVFPEFKYSFIFKGYLKKISKIISVKNQDGVEGKDVVNNQLYSLGNKLSDEFIPISIEFVEKFVKFCVDENIKVFIAEGQYNPLSYSAKNIELNKLVSRKLSEISTRYASVYFVGRKDLVSFEKEDFVDVYHVNSIKGYEFSKSLISLIEGAQ